MKGLIVAVIAALCAVYLVNPTWGVLELIPDNMPVVGNLDEATATAILIACLRYFGVDWTRFFGRRPGQQKIAARQGD
jgi:uncharacterized membrane protein YkvA (DUF1232 family)